MIFSSSSVNLFREFLPLCEITKFSAYLNTNYTFQVESAIKTSQRHYDEQNIQPEGIFTFSISTLSAVEEHAQSL